jgi:Uma2 family endonuclease
LIFLVDDGIVVDMKRSQAVAAPKLMTVDDYFRTPETLAPMELIYGALRVADAPSVRHQSLVANLFLALDAHVRARHLGSVWFAPLDVVLDERRALIVQPDLMFISNERQAIVAERIRGAPDLVIEVLSPEPRIGRTDERVDWFRRYGVLECWLVHQHRREVTVIDLDGAGQCVYTSGDSICSRVLPDFNARVAQILSMTE